MERRRRAPDLLAARVPLRRHTGQLDEGFVRYRVADGVLAHEAVGVGMYSFFREHAVNMKTAAQTSTSPGVKLKHACTKFLNGQGSIAHVVNALGHSTSSALGSSCLRLSTASSASSHRFADFIADHHNLW